MIVHFIDTSVFLYILEVPGKSGDKEIKDQIKQEYKRIIENRKNELLILPYATIIETGNHISHVDDKTERRNAAEKYKAAIIDTIRDNAPWRYYGRQFEPEDLEAICSDFPDKTQQYDLGIGDLSIIRAYEKYKDTIPCIEKMRIWSIDSHLSNYVDITSPMYKW